MSCRSGPRQAVRLLPRAPRGCRATHPWPQNARTGYTSGFGWNRLQIIIDGFAGLLGEFEAHRSPGLVLTDGCPVHGIATRRDIAQPEADQIASAQLAVDSEVEQRQIALAPRQLRIAQICLSLSGGLAPISLPLFQGRRSVPERDNERWSVMVNS